MGLAPSKKTNVLFLEKIAPLRVTHAGVRCEDSAQRKTNKMASEITFVEDEEIQFLSSVSLRNLRRALGENFLDSDSGFKDYTSESDDGSENISAKPVAKVRRTCRTRIFPLDGRKVLRAKKASIYEKTDEGETGRKREKTSRKYIFPLRTYRN